MNHFPILFHLNKFTILTIFSSCSVVRWPLNMHLLIKNQVLASRKNMISSAFSALLTYTGIFRLNGNDSVYFIFCYVVFFPLIYFMKKCNNCCSVDLILYTFPSLLYGCRLLKANILSSPQSYGHLSWTSIKQPPVLSKWFWIIPWPLAKYRFDCIYECLRLGGKWKFGWFPLQIKIFSISANTFCDAGQVPDLRYFKACNYRRWISFYRCC